MPYSFAKVFQNSATTLGQPLLCSMEYAPIRRASHYLSYGCFPSVASSIRTTQLHTIVSAPKRDSVDPLRRV